MTVPGDATTGERQYRAAWFAISEQGEKSGTGDGQVLRSPDYAELEPAAEDARIAGLLPYVTEAWVEVAEWRRLDSPERIHGLAGGRCRKGELGFNQCNAELDAYAALDVDDPTLTEMPWRAKP